MGAPWEKEECAQGERFAEPHLVGRIRQPVGEGFTFTDPLILKLSSIHCVHRTQQTSTQLCAEKFMLLRPLSSPDSPGVIIIPILHTGKQRCAELGHVCTDERRRG